MGTVHTVGAPLGLVACVGIEAECALVVVHPHEQAVKTCCIAWKVGLVELWLKLSHTVQCLHDAAHGFQCRGVFPYAHYPGAGTLLLKVVVEREALLAVECVEAVGKHGIGQRDGLAEIVGRALGHGL